MTATADGWRGIPRPILFTYLLSILYNVTFFMQFVTMPYVIKSLGISDSDNGLLQTVFGIIQVVGGPIFGYATQRFGIRISLFLCYGSTLISGIWLYFAQDFTSILLSRLAALFMHGQQGHQTLLSALTEPGEQRTKAFGRMGLTFGLGFMFTPILCMLSSKLISERAPFLLSALLSLLPFIVLETCISRKEYEMNESILKTSPSDSSLNLTNAMSILRRPGVFNVLCKKNAPIVPALLLFSIMQLFMINEFKMDSDMSHFVQLVTGIYIMFSNGFGVIWLRSRFDEQKLLFIGMTSFLIGYFLFFFFYRFWLIFVIMPFISLGMSVVATVADSMLTSLVDEHQQGLVLGVSTSFNSLVRTIAPALAGQFLDNYGFSVFPFIGTLSTGIGFLLLFLLPLAPELLKKKSV